MYICPLLPASITYTINSPLSLSLIHIYLLHPWSIVLVRGAAKLTGLEALLIQNSLAHFCAVAALTLCAALVLDALRPLRPAPGGRAWKELDLDALRHNARTLRSALSLSLIHI